MYLAAETVPDTTHETTAVLTAKPWPEYNPPKRKSRLKHEEGTYETVVEYARAPCVGSRHAPSSWPGHDACCDGRRGESSDCESARSG
ncbi:hypothetical protein SBA4_5980006 [Candidatus Sulfopaludibacter sp. SbA4]|nr:hypothetical protein SBA4_5980006 [Candidatus Sulfopaludibacter sp. SbA4]